MGTYNATRVSARMIQGECRIRNIRSSSVDFNATAWFVQASDEAIQKLLESRMYSPTEDAVAHFVAERGDRELQKLLEVIQTSQSTRYPLEMRTALNRLDVCCWVQLHRKELSEKLKTSGLLVLA